jgi:hypothetical protein
VTITHSAAETPDRSPPGWTYEVGGTSQVRVGCIGAEEAEMPTAGTALLSLWRARQTRPGNRDDQLSTGRHHPWRQITESE